MVVAEFLSSLVGQTGQPEFPTQDIRFLLALHNHGELPQSQLEMHTGVSYASVSRMVVRLGAGVPAKKGTPAKPGMGLVHSYPDPLARASMMVLLTPKGSALMRSVIDHVDNLTS